MDAAYEFFNAVLGLVPPVVPAAVLIAILIDLGKRWKLVKDGQAGFYSLALNAAFWVALYVAGELQVRDEAEAVIVKLGEIAPVVVALLTALWLSPKVHEFAEARGFGYSFPKAPSLTR